jgi:hypothetical protein
VDISIEIGIGIRFQNQTSRLIQENESSGNNNEVKRQGPKGHGLSLLRGVLFNPVLEDSSKHQNQNAALCYLLLFLCNWGV